MGLDWLIIGGCPRSGTTGLMASLNNLPAIGLFPEYGSERLLRSLDTIFFKERVIQRKSWVGDINLNAGNSTEVLTSKFIDFVPRYREDFDPLLLSIYTRVFGDELRLLGEKYPQYWTQDLEYIRSHTRKLKIIHLIRHPASVIASYEHRRKNTIEGKDIWPRTSIYDGIWDWCEATLHAYRVQANEDTLIVKYEELFDGGNGFRRISSFLGLPEVKSITLGPPRVIKDTQIMQPKVRRIYEQVLQETASEWGASSESVLLEKFGKKNLKYELNKCLLSGTAAKYAAIKFAKELKDRIKKNGKKSI